MTPLEIFAILVLAGVVIILLYYFLREMSRTGSANFDTFKSGVTEARRGASEAGSRVTEGISQQYRGENVEGESRMSGVTERVSGYGGKIKGKVKEVPISTDVFSGRIDEFLDERSSQLIKDWSLATKSDLGDLEKKYSKVSRDVDDLSKRFDEFRNHSNKKFESIEERLEALDEEEEPNNTLSEMTQKLLDVGNTGVGILAGDDLNLKNFKQVQKIAKDKGLNIDGIKTKQELIDLIEESGKNESE